MFKTLPARLILAVAALLVAVPAPAQTQQSFALVTANVAAPAITAYGGNYILSQTCGTYGTVTLQVRGPDGATYQTVVSKTAADTTGGSIISLASFANVRATLTGTAGCYVQLARVP
jgi:hypothetical protein